MRIVWLANGIEGYGIARAAVERMKQVRHAGHEPMLCAVAAGNLAAQSESLRFPTHVIGRPPASGVPGRGVAKLAHLPRAVVSTLRVRNQIAKALGALKADVVHVIQPTLLAPGGWAAQHVGAACAWEIANSIEGRLPFALNRRMYQTVCNRYRVLPIANSRYTASTLGPTRLPAIVLHHATDITLFDPATVEPLPRENFNLPREALVGVVCARVTPSKGQEEILRALALVRRQFPAAIFVVFVGGPGGPADYQFSARLPKLAKALGVEDRVVFAGPSSDVARYYAMADFSISFRIDPEPFGLSIIESMLMSKPPIVHSLGGPQETVEHGVSGWHVPEPTPEALAAVLALALGDRAGLRGCGDAARRRALRLYDPSCQIDAYLATTERIATEARRRRTGVG